MSSNRIDLSALPFPNVIEQLDFEAELLSCKQDLIARDPELAPVLNLESEPLTKLLETISYRLLLKSAEINAKAKALMLAYATGTDLDHLAANRNVYRKTIIEAALNANPPIQALMEDDKALRRRVQLEPESQSAGSVGAYQFWSLGAHGHVKDIAVDTPQSGYVDIFVQSHLDDVAPQSLLNIVDQALDRNTKCPFTDLVTVKAATPLAWSVNATLVLFPGPDSAVVKTAAEDELNIYIQMVSAIGYDVTRSGIYHALHVAGVQNVILLSPSQDLVSSKSHYTECTGISLTITEFRDV